LTVTGATFTSNTVTGGTSAYGGAICVTASASAASSAVELTLSDCTFTENKADGDGYGGAVYIKLRTNASVTGCTFENNTAKTADGSNAGLGGAICADGTTLTISGGSFSGNTAERNGGAVYGLNSAVTVADTCSITGNTAGATDLYAGQGGGIGMVVNSDKSASLTLASGVTVSGNTVFNKSETDVGLGADIYLETGVDYTPNGATVTDIYPVQTNDGGTGESESQPESGETT